MRGTRTSASVLRREPPLQTQCPIITVPHDRYRTLASEVDVGPLHLRPGGTRLVEYLRSEPWRLDGVTVFETWPVIVEGDPMVPASDEPTISAYGNPETANERRPYPEPEEPGSPGG